MKLVNVRDQWVVQGMLVAKIPEGVKPTNDELATFWNATPGDGEYEHLSRPAKRTRYVLLKDSGSFVIVPITPDIREYVA